MIAYLNNYCLVNFCLLHLSFDRSYDKGSGVKGLAFAALNCSSGLASMVNCL